jgi:hypothetical protein
VHEDNKYADQHATTQNTVNNCQHNASIEVSNFDSDNADDKPVNVQTAELYAADNHRDHKCQQVAGSDADLVANNEYNDDNKTEDDASHPELTPSSVSHALAPQVAVDDKPDSNVDAQLAE